MEDKWEGDSTLKFKYSLTFLEEQRGFYDYFIGLNHVYEGC